MNGELLAVMPCSRVWSASSLRACDPLGFYTSHHQDFFLNESKIHHTLSSLSKEIYETFLNLQSQCETRWIRDTRDYLEFHHKFVSFAQEYADVFDEEFMRKTLKNFDIFFDNEIRQPLEKKKAEVKSLYLKLQKKLKSLHGHPNNRNLLEKLEIEAKITDIEAREILSDIETYPLDKLQEKYDTIVEEFYTLKNLLPEVEEIPNPLKVIEEDLFLQLHEKVNKLKDFVNIIEGDEHDDLKQACLKHCKSFLSFYKKIHSPGGSYIEDPEISPSITLKSEFTVKTISTKSTSLTKTYGTSTVILSIGEVDVYLVDLKEIYNRYCKELERNNFDELITKLNEEWNYAVETVLNLYKVKYDQ